MQQREIDRRVYGLAWEFLLNLRARGVTETLIEMYLNPKTLKPRPKDIAGIYARFLQSAQNAGRTSNIVGEAIGGVDKLGKVLFRFDPVKVLAAYGSDHKQLLDDITKRLKPTGKVRRGKRSSYAGSRLNIQQLMLRRRDLRTK